MKRLERRLGSSAVASIGISSMLGSGIFVLPGLAFTYTGPSMWLAYLLAALTVLPAALSKSELATAMPTSGGTYVYLERCFGPFVGTVAGLGLWLSLLLKSAFALVGFGAYLNILAPTVTLIPTSLSILGFILLLNILGLGKVGGLLMIVVGLCILLLTLLSGLAIPHFNPQFLFPLFPAGLEGLMAATALVFVSYAGVTKVAAIAEEIRDPEKNLPRGILTALLATTFLYCITTFILGSTLPPEQLADNLKPIHLLATQIGGQTLGVITGLIAIITMSSMANSGILAASRFPFAMARDRLLPSLFGTLHQNFLTPFMAIIISGLFVAVFILGLDASKMAKFASTFMLMIYMTENIAVIILRETRVQWYRPSYKSILYPLPQIFGVLFTGALLLGMGIHLIIFGTLTIGVPGILLYLAYSRKRTDRKGILGMRGKRQDLIGGSSDLSPRKRLEIMDFNKKANVVVALFGQERSPEGTLEMGMALSCHGEGPEIAHITEVPEQTELSDILEGPAFLQGLERRARALAKAKGQPMTFDPIVSHDIAKTLYLISRRFHCQWLLMSWREKTWVGPIFHSPMGRLKEHLSCNLGIFRDCGTRYIKKVMIYLTGGPNDSIAVKTADHLALAYKASLTLVKYLPLSSSKEEKERAQKEVQGKSKLCTGGVICEIVKGPQKVNTLIDMTVKFDLLVFGSGDYSFWNRLKGTFDDALIHQSACSVFSVQAPPSFHPSLRERKKS